MVGKRKLRPLVSRAKCSKCGLPVSWAEIGGKWSLNNPDGAEHWDLCKQTIRKGDKAEAKLFGHTTRASLSLIMMCCRGNDGVQ